MNDLPRRCHALQVLWVLRASFFIFSNGLPKPQRTVKFEVFIRSQFASRSGPNVVQVSNTLTLMGNEVVELHRVEALQKVN